MSFERPLQDAHDHGRCVTTESMEFTWMDKLYIEPTSRCNLNCEMCFRNSWINEKTGDMTEAVFESALYSVKKMPELKTVMFAGMGEPLMHKDICKMNAGVKHAGKRTELITNAMLLDQTMTDRLIFDGLDQLWVSVDGFDRKTYERIHRGSDFDLITKNISYFAGRRSSCRLGFAFIIMKDNADDIDKLNAFADRFSADEINLSCPIPSYPISKDDVLYESIYQIGKTHRVEERRTIERNKCPFIDQESCFIKWNGDVCPCMQLLHNGYTYLYDEKRTIMSYSFGNITDRPLEEIYYSSGYTDFRKRVRGFEFPDCTLCDGCDDRLTNETDCMFNDMPTCGACLWAQGSARCP